MLKFVHERECRDLCQDLRIGRPHTSSAMSLGNLETRIFKQKKQMVGNGVMFSRYGAPVDLTVLELFELLFATFRIGSWIVSASKSWDSCLFRAMTDGIPRLSICDSMLQSS